MRPDTRSTTRGNDRDTEITHRMVAPEVGDDSTTSAAHMTSDKASEAADAAVEAARAVVTAPLARALALGARRGGCTRGKHNAPTPPRVAR